MTTEKEYHIELSARVTIKTPYEVRIIANSQEEALKLAIEDLEGERKLGFFDFELCKNYGETNIHKLTAKFGGGHAKFIGATKDFD